jgi:hypothetical protein
MFPLFGTPVKGIRLLLLRRWPLGALAKRRQARPQVTVPFPVTALVLRPRATNCRPTTLVARRDKRPSPNSDPVDIAGDKPRILRLSPPDRATAEIIPTGPEQSRGRNRAGINEFRLGYPPSCRLRPPKGRPGQVTRLVRDRVCRSIPRTDRPASGGRPMGCRECCPPRSRCRSDTHRPPRRSLARR